MRRRFRGNKPMPKIGYGNDKKTRFHLPNGLKKFVVNNVRDLNVLLMNNRTFAAEIAHNVSARVINLIYIRREEPKLFKELNNSELLLLTQDLKLEPNKRNNNESDCSYLFKPSFYFFFVFVFIFELLSSLETKCKQNIKDFNLKII
jgi:hypothetical protein